MRKRTRRAAGLVAGVAMCAAAAQTHRVEKPQAVVRAVGVYEWTGELKKPKASRLVPVTVFIDGELHDAGVYQPQPIPFALEPGVEYEVQHAGTPEGVLVLETARHRTSDDEGQGDAWFGYGSYKTEAAVKAAAPLRVLRNNPVITSSKDADSKSGAAGSPNAKAGSEQTDSGRPTMRRRTDSDSRTQTSDGNSDATTTTGSGQETNSSDDVDRPTLKRRTPAEDKKARKQGDQPRVTAAGGSPGDDPDRPVLHRGGGPSDLGEASGASELMGTPPDLQQAAAVSDASTRPEHDFARAWSDEAEHTAILARMQALGRAKLASYGGMSSTREMSAAAASAESDPGRPELRRGVPAKGSAAGATPKAGSSSAARGAGRLSGASKSTGSAKAPVGSAMADEQLKGFTLSYGAPPVFVYTARTAGDERTAKYVTVVAEQQVGGELRTVLASVTDAGHLDRTPWMRFVDAVDAEASNRASLLFELRYASSRSFALYRVLGASATQLAATGSTP